MNQQLSPFASFRPQGLTAAAVGGVGGMRPPHISIDQNRFSLVDGSANVKQLPPLIVTDANGQQAAIVALDVVFIDANASPSKMFWGLDPRTGKPKEYNPSVTEPPECWSDNGKAPSSQAQKPQSPTCVACPHNAIGSAISKFSGSSIKACQDFKKLAALVVGVPGMEEMEFLMQVKPGSFKNWSSLIGWLKTQKKELPDVVVRMTFESQGVLKFEPVAWTEGNAELEGRCVAAWQKGATGEMVGKNDVPFAGQIAGPQQQVQQALPPPPPMQPVQTVQPPAPFGLATSPTAAAPSTQTAQPLAPSAPMSAAVSPFNQEPPARKRRTKAEMEAARQNSTPVQQSIPVTSPQPQFVSGLQQVPPTGAPAPAQDETDIPPFLRRQQQPAPPAPPPQANTGLANPQPMPADLAAKLNAAFEFPK